MLVANGNGGLKLRRTIEGERHPISSIAWAPNGRFLAYGSYDGLVRIFDVDRGLRLARFECEARINSVTWSPDSRTVIAAVAGGIILACDAGGGSARQITSLHPENPVEAICAPRGNSLAVVTNSGGLYVIDALQSRHLWRATDRLASVSCAAWSPDGRILVSACLDRTLRFWDSATPQVLKRAPAQRAHTDQVVWTFNNRWVITGCRDNTVRVWEAETGRPLYILEGHCGKVTCLAVSPNSRFLASQSADNTIRLWRSDTWETAAVIKQKSLDPAASRRIAFDPNSYKKPRLAVVDEHDNTVEIYEIESNIVMALSRSVPTVHYTNAKVVLLGDTSVGKTGLSLALTGKPFKATESTHGRFVLQFDQRESRRADGHKEIQETLLWDLAGQPGYRMIHQLHIDNVVVALVVFDSRSETDPFAGVRHWARALRVAGTLQTTAPRAKKFLVAARADRGGIAASQERINAIVRDLDFDGYFVTSAREQWGIPELKESIRNSIDWNALPTVSSTELFERVKGFFGEERRAEHLLATEQDLLRAFLRAEGVVEHVPELSSQFTTCLGRIDAQGLVRRLSFGNLILLEPELLDAYASMLVNAARDEPDGLGSIALEDVLAGRFRMPSKERLPNREQEKLLLLATCEELLDHEIALRESAGDGSYLVFPSQLTRERGDFGRMSGKAVVFEFQGPVLSVYATLAVRLSHSGIFVKADMWKSAASYRALTGGVCGIGLREIDEGHGEITVFFSDEVSLDTRAVFAQFVELHLLRRSSPDTVVKRRILTCSECGFVVTDQLLQLLTERGKEQLDCPVCRSPIRLAEAFEESGSMHVAVPQMDEAADAERDREVTQVILEGKQETREFDVFLAHKSNDKSLVAKLADQLRKRRLNPWLDKEQIPPGRWFSEVIQNAMRDVKSAAICIGPSGLGRWQSLELRVFTSQCVESGLPVIPVLLPGVREVPPHLPFLRELQAVRFPHSLADNEALDQLVYGITGRRVSPDTVSASASGAA